MARQKVATAANPGAALGIRRGLRDNGRELAERQQQRAAAEQPMWIRKLFDGQLKTMGVKDRTQYLMDLDSITTSSPDTEVMIIHPFLVWEYNKQLLRQECIRLGWKEPDLNDPNSSNCLLNAYAIKNHFDKYHIHSYAYDLSALVRKGNLKRDEALKTLNTKFSDASIEKVHRKLNPSKK